MLKFELWLVDVYEERGILARRRYCLTAWEGLHEAVEEPVSANECESQHALSHISPEGEAVVYA